MDFFRFVYYSFEGKNPRCRPRPILRHLRPNSPPLPRLRRNHCLILVRQFLRINSQKHSWTSQASRARNRTSCYMSSSKTFRTRRSLENVLFSESSSILVSLMARQVNRHEKLFEHSEFFEWLRKSDFRPPSSGRFCTFLLFLFISVTKEKKIPCRACPAYKFILF